MASTNWSCWRGWLACFFVTRAFSLVQVALGLFSRCGTESFLDGQQIGEPDLARAFIEPDNGYPKPVQTATGVLSNAPAMSDLGQAEQVIGFRINRRGATSFVTSL